MSSGRSGRSHRRSSATGVDLGEIDFLNDTQQDDEIDSIIASIFDSIDVDKTEYLSPDVLREWLISIGAC